MTTNHLRPLSEPFSVLDESESLKQACLMLEEVKNAGLVYWEPTTLRGHAAKAMMVARISSFTKLHLMKASEVSA